MRISRRALLLAAGAAPLARSARAEVSYATVTPRPLVFPRDHGAHPEYRTEWWYLTGWLDARGQAVDRLPGDVLPRQDDQSCRARAGSRRTQLVIAHAAIASTRRAAHCCTTNACSASASGWSRRRPTTRTCGSIAGASCAMPASGEYRGTIPARSFDLTLSARPTQPLLLQGRDGFSQKGPQATQASHYYSQPQLAVRATLRMDGATREASGIALARSRVVEQRARRRRGRLGLDRHEPRRRLRTDGVPDPLEDGRAASCTLRVTARGRRSRARLRGRRGALRSGVDLALAAHERDLPGRAAHSRRRAHVRDASADERPGTRLAGVHRGRVLGRCERVAGSRPTRRPRVP